MAMILQAEVKLRQDLCAFDNERHDRRLKVAAQAGEKCTQAVAELKEGLVSLGFADDPTFRAPGSILPLF